jgi:hypothetical protein
MRYVNDRRVSNHSCWFARHARVRLRSAFYSAARGCFRNYVDVLDLTRLVHKPDHA